MIPIPIRAHLFTCLAEVEYNLSRGCSDKLQLAALVGSFQEVRHMVASAAAQQTAAL